MPQLRLTCLVDNCVAFAAPLWGEHGLSFLAQSADANLLWDTGQSGTVLRHNLEALQLSHVPLAAVALSHAHSDHIGGLDAVRDMFPGVPICAHADILRERYSQREGRTREIGLDAEGRARAQRDGWRLSAAPEELIPHVWTTGTIGERRYPLSAGSHLRAKIDDALAPDPFRDDQALVLEVAGGIVLLLGCCHAGLRNTLATVRGRWAAPLLAIIGGSHLAEVGDEELAAIVQALRAEHCPKLYLNHCTGEHARMVLWRSLGDCVAPCPAGTVLEF